MRVDGVTVELMVQEVAATLRFWTEQLGFDEIAREPEHDPTWGQVARGPSRIGFKQADRLRSEFDWFDGLQQGGTVMLCIDVADLRETYEETRRRLSVIDHPHITPCGATQFAIRDPDGYVIVFQHFGPVSESEP